MERPRAENPERSSFKEQFEHVEHVRLPSGTAEVGDFMPENLKEKTPVFFATGWGCTMKDYEGGMQQLFEGAHVEGDAPMNRRRVISLNHPRMGGAIDSSMNVKELSKDYPAAQLRKALNVLEVLETKGVEQVDAIAHSEAATVIGIAAMMYPEKFRTIAFFGPAGMMEDESWARLTAGYVKQFFGGRAESLNASPPDEHSEGRPEIPITDAERAVIKTTFSEGLKYFVKNPARAISEILAIKSGHRRTKDLLPYLHDLGINIAVISAESDPMFPYEEIRKAANIDAVDTFISVRGGHGVIAERPEIVMPSIETALEELSKKEKTSEQRDAIASREHHAGVRYIPGEGLAIAPYIKKRGE